MGGGRRLGERDVHRRQPAEHQGASAAHRRTRSPLRWVSDALNIFGLVTRRRKLASTIGISVRQSRSEIAALKRRVQDLERQLRRVGRAGESSQPAAANEDSVSPGTRFSARSMASQRRRLGLSAAECGLLVGASAQSIYNWEEGKARPRAQHRAAIYALRNLGRRQASEILETRKAA